MKKYLIVIFVFSLSILFSSSNTGEVYICLGKYAKKYHLVNTCRGLNNCKAEINNVTLENAKRKGRTLCGWED